MLQPCGYNSSSGGNQQLLCGYLEAALRNGQQMVRHMHVRTCRLCHVASSTCVRGACLACQVFARLGPYCCFAFIVRGEGRIIVLAKP